MSKVYDVTGKIHSVGQTTEYGSNGFRKREFTILVTGPDENPTYPNHLKLELIKDKCESIDAFEMGQEIQISFNLNGRLWEGNGKPETCFNSLQAWKIEATTQAPPQQQQQATAPTQAETPAPMEFDDNIDTNGSEIPF